MSSEEGRGMIPYDRAPRTRWSRLSLEGPEDFEEFYVGYKRFCVETLRRWFPTQDLEDRFHAFLEEKVMTGGVLERADPRRGSFRKYLYTVLEHFAIDRLRRDSTRRRGGRESHLSIEELTGTGREVAGRRRARLDHDWTRHLLRRAFAGTRRAFAAAGRVEEFDRFLADLFVRRGLTADERSGLRAAAGAAEAEAILADLEVRLDLASGLWSPVVETRADIRRALERVDEMDSEASKSLRRTVRRHLRRTVRLLVAEAVDESSAAPVDLEIDDLLGAIVPAGPVEVTFREILQEAQGPEPRPGNLLRAHIEILAVEGGDASLSHVVLDGRGTIELEGIRFAPGRTTFFAGSVAGGPFRVNGQPRERLVSLADGDVIEGPGRPLRFRREP